MGRKTKNETGATVAEPYAGIFAKRGLPADFETGAALAKSGKSLATAREAGATWDEIGTLVRGDPARPVSAITLRVPYRAYLAADGEAAVRAVEAGNATVTPLPAKAAAIVRARDGEGAGFPLLAARTGLSVADVRKLYLSGGGESADGRIYVASSGARTLVLPGGERTSLPPFDAKAAKRRAADRAAAAVAAADGANGDGPTPDVEPTKAERKAAKAAKAERKAAKAAKRERKAAKAARKAA